jgi:hypothetical protein
MDTAGEGLHVTSAVAAKGGCWSPTHEAFPHRWIIACQQANGKPAGGADTRAGHSKAEPRGRTVIVVIEEPVPSSTENRCNGLGETAVIGAPELVTDRIGIPESTDPESTQMTAALDPDVTEKVIN